MKAESASESTSFTTVTIVGQHRSSSGARQVKVKRATEDGVITWWVVSSVVAPDTGKLETLAFEGHEDGWDFGSPRAGGIGQHREDVIRTLSDPNFQPSDGGMNAWCDDLGGPALAVLSTMSLMNDVAMGRLPYDDSDGV